MAEQIRL